MSDHVTPVASLTLAAGRHIAESALAEAERLGVRVVVSVCDASGDPVVTLRADGAFRFSLQVAADKAWTATVTGARTCDLADQFNGDPTLLHGLAPKVPRLMAVGGGTPVMIDGVPAGAVGVSGATDVDDQAIADAAAASIGSVSTR